MIAAMAVSRGLRAGCNAGKDSSCARMSGDALQRIQFSPMSLMAMDDWVRAWPRSVPARSPLQLAQLQFHCGKPPPAAEPRIWMNMRPPRSACPKTGETIGDRRGVARYVDHSTRG